MGCSYLDGAVASAIEEKVDLILKEKVILTAPINYKYITDSEGLQLDLFSNGHPEFHSFSEAVGEEKAKMFRGVLDVHEKQIYVKDDGYEKRINFTTAHELAHWSLPWHKELFYCCSEFDLTHQARAQLEREANYFASRLGFMNGRFNLDLRDLELSIKNIQTLSDVYNLSIEACLRSAVENEDRPCAVMVMTSQHTMQGYVLHTKFVIHSKSFEQQLGKINKQAFPAGHSITNIMNNFAANISNTDVCETMLGQGANAHPIKVDLWKNKFYVFGLVTPR